jgi:hypothetical protein
MGGELILAKSRRAKRGSREPVTLPLTAEDNVALHEEQVIGVAETPPAAHSY